MFELFLLLLHCPVFALLLCIIHIVLSPRAISFPAHRPTKKINKSAEASVFWLSRHWESPLPLFSGFIHQPYHVPISKGVIWIWQEDYVNTDLLGFVKFLVLSIRIKIRMLAFGATKICFLWKYACKPFNFLVLLIEHKWFIWLT